MSAYRPCCGVCECGERWCVDLADECPYCHDGGVA